MALPPKNVNISIHDRKVTQNMYIFRKINPKLFICEIPQKCVYFLFSGNIFEKKSTFHTDIGQLSIYLHFLAEGPFFREMICTSGHLARSF